VRKQLSFARRATADLEEIWDYSERNWGKEQAVRYASEIAARCSEFADGKIISQEIDLRSGRFLRIRSGSHLIFLRELPGELHVVRILHERPDAEAALDRAHSTQSSPISR
jgi:toxin ParE1/3/4